MTLIERISLGIFGALARTGTLQVILPGGQQRAIGSGEPAALIQLKDHSAVGDVLRAGVMGFADAYMDERIKTPDLPALMEWSVANRSAWFEHPLARATTPARRLWQRIRPERRHPRVRTMGDHYNLGNDFYRAWLDETMAYSSARFAYPEQSLADAQINKYRIIADHAGLEPGMRVLEIGCGWGGFAAYAAGNRGCEVVGITLSEEQALLAKQRLAEKGLADRVDIRLEDFRDVDSEFDAIVSIEMIESVDETHWPALFTTIAQHLRAGGKAAMQTITIADDAWERYRTRADFIQQYIFPGGQLPAPKILTQLAARAGLIVQQVETFGLDYARTLALWRERFEAAWTSLRRDNGLDARFHRMWDLYLSLCEAGFRIGRINVEQWVFAR